VNVAVNWTLIAGDSADFYLISITTNAVSSGGAPTPAGTSVFSKHNWDKGMGYLWLNGWGINHLMGGAFMGTIN